MTTPTAIETLAEYATGLRIADIPADVAELAGVCLADAVACTAFGAQFPWSRAVQDQALAVARAGRCRLPFLDLPQIPAETAALLAGTFAHAYELDSLRMPGAGVHPGATVAMPALMVAQQVGAGPDDLVRAIVAGIEVMLRIGDATLHSAEARGFHAPGITGPFGATVAAAVLHGLPASATASAMGIAASCGGGLLAFAGSSGGGMVKRLHMGRAAQAGVTAAELARRGFEGPLSALEGRFGLLEAYCPASDPDRLVAGLGTEFETRTLCIKHYACHVTAQAPVEMLRAAMTDHGFTANDIDSIDLGVSDKVRSHHAAVRPSDAAGAQYSVPFAMAAAAFDDPEDPLVFERAVTRDDVAALSSRTTLQPQRQIRSKWGAEMSLRLRSGATIECVREAFLGTPERPMSCQEFGGKFRRLTGASLPDMRDIAAEWL